MSTLPSRTAAEELAEHLTRRNIACSVNGDSAGYEVLIDLPAGQMLCITASPDTDGYDWQTADQDGQQIDAGTWAHTRAADAAELARTFL